MVTERRKKKLKKVLSNRQPDFTLVFEDVWDPHNVAAVLRTADAFGVLNCHLVYQKSEFPNLKRVGRASSSSANKWVDLKRNKTMNDCVLDLHREGKKVYSTVISAKGTPLQKVDFVKPCAVMFGNEKDGLTKEAIELSDEQITIPMVGLVQSLNISVSAGIIMWEMFRQRHAKGMYPHDWQPSEFNDLLKDWMER